MVFMNAIDKPPKYLKSHAITWAGSQAALARKLDVTDSAVSQWAEDDIPEGRCWQLLVLGCPPVEVDKREPA